jgi:hypothetical protein
MFQDFRITAVSTDIRTKSILLNTNFDIDPATVNDATVQVYDRVSSIESEIKAEVVNGKDILITFKEWPKPNVEYMIRVSDLKTVLGEPLVSGLRRKIVFESSICSRLAIISPAYNEVITNLKVVWKEVLAESTDTLVGSYYLEISTENAFHNLVRDTIVTSSTELDIRDIPNGQYYVRGRVQKDNEYSLWSDVITFLVGDESANPDPIYDPEDGEPLPSDDDMPIYNPDIQIVSVSEDGITPESIMIEFDCDIDPASIVDIILIRRSL